ncbi:hypothetical protein LINPERHAP1_LOCUS28683 [Linum perenne]
MYRSLVQTNQRIYFDVDPHGQHLGTDIVNGFAFHPSLPMAVSSSVHCRFQVPDDEDANFQLTDDENCVSVWSFSCESTIKIGDIDKILAV